MSNIINFTDYSFRYATGEHPAINKINLQVSEGEITVICGRSGSGKSTLIKCMKKEITPAGKSVGKADINVDSREIAIVFQDPDTQLVNQTVLDDLVFYMENLRYDKETMRKKLAETVGFFGLEPLLHKQATELSGGQRQLVALCAALMTKPKLLLLDEPTSQLDPIASREFWDTLKRIHEEFGVAMVITEHRLDHVAAFANKTALMENGSICYWGEIEDVFKRIYQTEDKDHIKFIPDIPRLSLALSLASVCFTPAEFKKSAKPPVLRAVSSKTIACSKTPLLSMKNIFYAYESSADFVLRNMYFEFFKGERLCIFGGNGSGKTTFLKMLCKIIKPLSGYISKNKYSLSYMPQNLKSYFRFETVAEEIAFSGNGATDKTLNALLGITHLLGRHPLDLSGGEAQKVVLACMLMEKPDIIVMDEPTKGLDPYAKDALADLLKRVDATIVMATHDISFAAGFASRCAMIFDGSLAFSAPPQEFFKHNDYYTTSINLGVRHLDPHALTWKEALSLWRPQ